jgi:hypothetical protein
MPKQTKKSLKAKCDKLCGQVARSLGYCENCGKRETLSWCHIHTRSIGKLRYDRRNWVCLCASCHRHFHNKPLQFTQFITKIKGQETVDWLIRESNKLEPLDLKWYQLKLEELTKQL